MKNLTSKELRALYLQFFRERGHAVIPSASLIPENDPTVLFTTAGMHPLVPYLMGQTHPAGKRLPSRPAVTSGSFSDPPGKRNRSPVQKAQLSFRSRTFDRSEKTFLWMKSTKAEVNLRKETGGFSEFMQPARDFVACAYGKGVYSIIIKGKKGTVRHSCPSGYPSSKEGGTTCEPNI